MLDDLWGDLVHVFPLSQQS